jgi:hypothetical protein
LPKPVIGTMIVKVIPCRDALNLFLCSSSSLRACLLSPP